ncbi:MAG: hypothetical protein WC803_09330 [Sphingomonas sp.]
MFRFYNRFAALAALSLFASPALAESANYYSATPVAAPTKASFITTGTLWKCADGTCTARQSTQRDIIMCQIVVQRLGAVSGFSAGGTAFDAAAIAKCNERAR